MNHLSAALCHFLATACHGEGYYRVAPNTSASLLCDAIPRARELGLVESPSDSGARLDKHWLRLTPKGREAVNESICSMGEVA